jgi:hypothetical protein
MSHYAVAAQHEEHQLGVPVIGTQRPSVMEHDRLTAAPVLVEDLGAVLGGDEGHVSTSWGDQGRRAGSRFDRPSHRADGITTSPMMGRVMILIT